MHGTFVSSPGIDVLYKYEPISNKVQFRRFLALTDYAINKYELLNAKTAFEENSAEAVAPLSDEIYTYLHGDSIPGGLNEEIDKYNVQVESLLPTKVSNKLRAKRSGAYILNNAFEQEPNWNSRIELIENKDYLGMKRVKLSFNAKDSDIKRYIQYFELLAKTVGELGLGRLSYDRTGEVFYTQQECGASHHTGTTRMSLNYSDGVVDTNCKIHGFKNLYVASASVFPTPSQANPTFTISALSIRLADFLIGLKS
jgi:choline dehydrogenase-like flavoprotein